jgi:hypothetical protein
MVTITRRGRGRFRDSESPRLFGQWIAPVDHRHELAVLHERSHVLEILLLHACQEEEPLVDERRVQLGGSDPHRPDPRISLGAPTMT